MNHTPVFTRKALVFREYVEQAFEAAAADFQASPDAENWRGLRVAMWAWQHVHSMSPVLPDVAHEHLCAIAARAKGDDDFSEAG